MSAPYVPLRVFSSFTMLEGAIEPKAIAKQAQEARLSRRRADRPQRPLCRDAVQRSLLGRRASSRSSARCWQWRGRPTSAARRARSTGWCCWPRTRTAIPTSAGWFPPPTSTAPASEDPHVDMAALDGATDGLIALTAGGEGAHRPPVRRRPGRQAAKAYAARLQAAVPRPPLHRTVAARRRRSRRPPKPR